MQKPEHSFITRVYFEPVKGQKISDVLREAWVYSIANSVEVAVNINSRTLFIDANCKFEEWFFNTVDTLDEKHKS